MLIRSKHTSILVIQFRIGHGTLKGTGIHMAVKNEVLHYLELHRGEYVSGEELAKALKVSRTAIWKAIKQLEVNGYKILAITNRGYCLSLENDVISKEGIRNYLTSEMLVIPIQVENETTSTNMVAKLAAMNGAEHGSVFIAEKQTKGRGRLGRSFLSLDGSGIYMSILLRPNVTAADAIYITTAASVAVYRAILSITGKQTKIKWVNDIYYEERKICGILTEAVTDVETGIVHSIIIGIGINFNVIKENIPKELKDIVGALYYGDSGQVTRNQLIAEIINQVLTLCIQKNREFMKDYKENSMLLGTDIWVISGNTKIEAKAIDINEDGGLIIKLSDGSIQTLNTGEVSIRKR